MSAPLATAAGHIRAAIVLLTAARDDARVRAAALECQPFRDADCETAREDRRECDRLLKALAGIAADAETFAAEVAGRVADDVEMERAA